MTRIDEGILPPGFKEGRQEGLCAEFYPNGRLRFYGWIKNGSSRSFWVLHLEEDRDAGKAVREDGYWGSPVYELYKDGAWEAFDPFSDNQKPKSEDFEVWVRRWVKTISQSWAG